MKDTFRFDDLTLQTLKLYGWNEHREIDITDYLAYYETTNQAYNSLIMDFLSSFGELLFKIPTKSEGIYSHLIINPLQGKSSMGLTRLQRQISKLNQQLCIVGLAENQTLLMTQKGATYCVFNDMIFLMGKTIEESMHTLLIICTPCSLHEMGF